MVLYVLNRAVPRFCYICTYTWWSKYLHILYIYIFLYITGCQYINNECELRLTNMRDITGSHYPALCQYFNNELNWLVMYLNYFKSLYLRVITFRTKPLMINNNISFIVCVLNQAVPGFCYTCIYNTRWSINLHIYINNFL